MTHIQVTENVNPSQVVAATYGSLKYAHRIDSQNQLLNGETTLTLSYDLPCWASAVTPEPLFDALDIQSSPVNPAADFAIAVGVLVKGNPMLPCVGSTRNTTAKIVSTDAVEGDFLGFRVIAK